MDLITFAVISVVSAALGVAGSRLILGTLFSFLQRPTFGADATDAAHLL